MHRGPFHGEAERSWRQRSVQHPRTIDRDLNLVLSVRCVEVRRQVIPELHSNDDPEEPRNLRHRPTVRTDDCLGLTSCDSCGAWQMESPRFRGHLLSRQRPRWRGAAGSLECGLSRAGVTQLAECQLPKLNVAGSNPVSRSRPPSPYASCVTTDQRFVNSLRLERNRAARSQSPGRPASRQLVVAARRSIDRLSASVPWPLRAVPHRPERPVSPGSPAAPAPPGDRPAWAPPARAPGRGPPRGPASSASSWATSVGMLDCSAAPYAGPDVLHQRLLALGLRARRTGSGWSCPSVTGSNSIVWSTFTGPSGVSRIVRSVT